MRVSHLLYKGLYGFGKSLNNGLVAKNAHEVAKPMGRGTSRLFVPEWRPFCQPCSQGWRRGFMSIRPREPLHDGSQSGRGHRGFMSGRSSSMKD